MFYFSSILDRAVKNEDGDKIGKIKDILIKRGENFPYVDHIVMFSRGKMQKIGWDMIKHIDQEGVIILGKEEIYQEIGGDEKQVFLKKDILDKQIVDINGHRVVRVNDIQLNMVGKSLRVAGVDVGTPGLLRRMGLLDISEIISRILNLKTPTNIIPWDMVQPLGIKSPSPIKLSTTRKKLTKLHPADLADILEDLPGKDRVELFQVLDNETAADTLEQLEDDVQIALFKALSDEKAADLLEEMSPDDAADLLQDMPDERVEELLNLMDSQEANEVKELLLYEEDTAGGLMSNEFVAVSPDMTCGRAIDLIRERAPEYELVYHLYIVDKNEKLLGVLSLRDIIVSKPDTVMKEIMNTNIISLLTNADKNKVTEVIAKYDLLAVPVVDENNIIKGIVTVDDVIEQLLGK